MDKEQAIEKLRSQRDEICNGCLHAVGWCESHCGFSEAINIAIEALKEQLSCEGTTEVTISRQAVKYLDLFTKTYCRDESATDDLVFRCSDCEFELRPSGKCLVKCMARKLCPDYKDFGSMGDL